MISDGVCNKTRSGRSPICAISITPTVTAAPITKEPATARFNKSLSPTPKLLATTMLSPFPNPSANPTSSS